MELFIIIILLIALVFLGNEFLKKGKFLGEFLNSSPQIIEWEYKGGETVNPGMYNMILSGSSQFTVLIGFDLEIPIIGYIGYDPYGFVSSNQNHQVIISTYLGRKPTKFRFLVNIPNMDIRISSTKEDQLLVPMKAYPPHWWQRLGL
ncbi:MAG: hypothetical protein Q8K26_03440 [Candidatus Gracilibacteria bacterium]|nr:hypothetical protein [Candidatus Gracilibacteria bacterium]